MHRLLTKKHRDDEQPKSTNKLRSFKRNKSQPPPASRPQVDLTQALPPTDDFRISLMMPNLEKRFSVLREGEQGHGPGVNGIGYGALASGTMFSDGRDNEFVRPPPGGAGLADITEVASIRSGSRAEGSIDLTERPNVNQGEDYNGGVMNRPRHGEGNVLFGGRQKVYRINPAATGSSEDIGESPLSPIGRGRMGGRALYTDDLPLSSGFSKSPADKGPGRSQSPPPSNYNLDRNTQSSTTSGPSSLTRSSTTATSTSTNSRNFTPNAGFNQFNSATSSKPRKLIYEQALDRDVNERELNALENHRLAIMGQKRTGSASPHPYADEDEKRRQMSPHVRSFTRPFSPHNEPETRGRSRSPAQGSRGSHQREDQDVPQVAAPESEHSSSVPFSFGFEERNDVPKSSYPGLNTLVNHYGLPTPRPESDEYQEANPQHPTPVAANGPTPSPSPLTENYARDPSISHTSESAIDGERAAYSISRRSSASDLGPGNMQQTTFFEASDSEREIDDGASSVYEDDPYLPFEEGDDSAFSPRNIIPAFSPQKPPMFSPMSSPPLAVHDSTPLHDSDSPTLPPNAGLSTMIRQHLRSDSGISSIYAPSMHVKVSEPHHEPASIAQAMAGWDNQYADYDEEAPFQSEAAVDYSEVKPKFSMAELKKKESDDKFQPEEQQGFLKSAPMERNPSENAISVADDEADEWRTQLEEKKRMLQQRLQEHSGRNSPAPGYTDASDEPQKNSILKPGVLGNMLKGKGSPAGSPGGREDKVARTLGISPMLNQSKDSFGRRDDEEEFTQERPEGKMRQMPNRPDMQPPHDMRSRGPGQLPRMPPHGFPYGHGPGPHQRPPQNGPQNQPLPSGPRSFVPMAAPPQPGSRKAPGHIPIDSGMPATPNMHRDFAEQGRNGPRPGPGMPPHMHRGPPSNGNGHEHPNNEFRPPHDRPGDHRGPPPQQGGRSRARSNAQRPNNTPHQSPPHSKRSVRGRPSEEELRGRQRGPSGRAPGVNEVAGVMTTVTAGSTPAPLNFDKKPQGPSRPKNGEPAQPREGFGEMRSPPVKTEAKNQETPAQDRRPANLTIPTGDIPQSKFSPEDSPQGFRGRFRSNSKSQKISSMAMFEQEAPPSMPSPPKQTGPVTAASSLAKTPIAVAAGSPAKTLAELTGSDGVNPAFQATGSASTTRDGKKVRIRKGDISEPTLLHTTSQMPVSKLIDAGGTGYRGILPPGLSDSTQRQRSGSDESIQRAARGGHVPASVQRTSDPDGEKARVLRKAVSDGGALRERAASSAKHPRPAVPSPAPFFGSDGRPLNAPPFFNNAPAGMI
ncbi:hypothetical protein Dda_9142 [Drechslerella dactyloides]|uniref:Uncharacterized protein n=1 Tax=Drechslerella dactyloides TaxID=74499 RepID=A0AAD6IR68_DREDA|nr:hypothetical protein Dda_9142 [Drechslerella dactyloides]